MLPAGMTDASLQNTTSMSMGRDVNTMLCSSSKNKLPNVRRNISPFFKTQGDIKVEYIHNEIAIIYAATIMNEIKALELYV